MAYGEMLCLALILSASQAEMARDVAALAKADRQVLRSCGASEALLGKAPDEDWTPVSSVEDRHVALRALLNEPMPLSRSMISIHAVGGDLETTEFSVILERGINGTWSGTAVGQSKAWIEGAKPYILPRKAWLLPDEKGRRLNQILADKCFYAEPTTFHRAEVPAVGVLYINVETRISNHQKQFSYKGGHVDGLSKELTDLAFPPSS
ncbi:hypothetical protein [Sphingomonas beigongshangi]|uniref:hypothetical protein n=1 Tax=Sphingomonas beigongshangi TaxID=2782540 RepID=UPI00193B0EBA|nr:hypothetical protein [Sphingomonas beigongshangi]